MLKVVLDNNTIVSALLTPYGSPGKVLDLAFQGAFAFAASPHLIDELTRVLDTKRMQSYLAKQGKTKKDTAKFIDNFSKSCILTSNSPLTEKVCRDPDDDWVLACALEAKAKYIVSGDKDLTSLQHYQGILILTPLDFLEEIN